MKTTRIARGTAPQRAVTRSLLVLALREAEQRANHKLASELREMLGALTEKNETVQVARRRGK